jgi:XTP/dITP diphosphohydrolase
MKLLVATRSPGKMREIRRILAAVPWLTVLDLDEAGLAPEPAEEELEPYDTFEANALSKARHFFERSGLPTVADDSGIEVDALDGAPGVRSKRFSLEAVAPADPARGANETADPPRGETGALAGRALDDANNRHLLGLLEGVPPDRRTARYVCVAALIAADAEPLVVRGEAAGVVVDEPRGSGGFGYDPHVYETGMGKTFAEMSAEEKDLRSHRGDAFRKLAARLTRRLAATDDPRSVAAGPVTGDDRDEGP